MFNIILMTRFNKKLCFQQKMEALVFNTSIFWHEIVGRFVIYGFINLNVAIMASKTLDSGIVS